MTDAKIPMGARVLFEELVRASGRRAYTWILQSELAERLGVSRRTVQRYERALAAAGLVTLARVSFWSRWRPGGSRRLAVPHVLLDGRLVCPPGVLDDDGRLLSGEGVEVRAEAANRRCSVVTRVSHQWRDRSSSKKKRNTGQGQRPNSPTPKARGRRIRGNLRACVDNAARYAKFLADLTAQTPNPEPSR